MRRSLGLASPERRIGQAAHDFAQAWCSAPQLMLTRALRVEGAPTVPSRWLLRLDSLLRLIGIEPETLHAGIWLGWQAELDQPGPVVPARPPAPRPPVAARPQRLSVTEIETWMRDPYAIYARRILRLDPLDPIDADPNAADRGSFIHDALEKFVKAIPARDCPPMRDDRLIELGRQAFGESSTGPPCAPSGGRASSASPRWFVDNETARRPLLAESFAEAKGELLIELPGCRPFTLRGQGRPHRPPRRGRARDHRLQDRGRAQHDRQVDAGYAPQLPLEAAMARAGAFEGIRRSGHGRARLLAPQGRPRDRRYPDGARPIPWSSPPRLSRASKQLIAEFEDPAMPYLPVPDPDFLPAAGPYDHLSRRGEWTVGRAMSADDVRAC